ncbi:hypothetical protein AAE478_005608 [Parahypoxylon ruwenzoriense]
MPIVTFAVLATHIAFAHRKDYRLCVLYITFRMADNSSGSLVGNDASGGNLQLDLQQTMCPSKLFLNLQLTKCFRPAPNGIYLVDL